MIVPALALPGWCNYCWELLPRQFKFHFKMNHILYESFKWNENMDTTPPAGASSKPQPLVVLHFCILSVQVQTLSFRKLCWMKGAGGYHLSIHL